MSGAPYVTGKEAAALLGIRIESLYSYVSRGLVRSEATAGRSRRYHAEDVERLRLRRQERKDPAIVARAALQWGTPVLESSLTLITERGPFYRGRSALELATAASFEEVAALLWCGSTGAGRTLFDEARRADRSAAGRMPRAAAELSPAGRLAIALTLAGESDLAAFDLSAGGVARTGARILRLIATVVAGGGEGAIARRLAAGWGLPVERTAPVLEAALILCADHELNASSFAARVVASTRAHPYLVVAAGLSALQGPAHGGNVARTEAMVRELSNARSIGRALAERVRRGEPLAGFGHRLYPNGDPRATKLLALLHDGHPANRRLRLAREIEAAAENELGLRATIDFALAVTARVLDLAPGGGFTLFALGRAAGWIAHAIEQYGRDGVIRPRAAYTGPPASG